MKWFGNEGECDTLDILTIRVRVALDENDKWQAIAYISTKASATGSPEKIIHRKSFDPCATDVEARARVDKWLESCASAMLRKV